MDYHRQFRQAAIERGIPEDAVTRFAGHLRFMIWATWRRDDTTALAGQCGGLPRLPAGVPWPSTTDDERLPLPFIAALDCAALPRVDSLPLPADGSLLFFLEHEYASAADTIEAEQEYARVVHVPAGTATVPVQDPPPGHDEWALNAADSPFVRPGYELTAAVHPELPNWLSDPDTRHLEFQTDVVRRLHGELTHLDELRTLVDELWPPVRGGAMLQLGGYTTELGVGDNPESHLASALAGETQQVMREWVPLVQFDTQDDVYYGHFLIRHDDLAAGRFDQALSFAVFTE